MKKVAKALLSGALLVGLAMPLSAMAADQEVMQKIDALTRELEALKQQMKESETKIKENESKTQEAVKKVEQTEKKSLGRWLEIGGDYRFRYDYLHGKSAPYWQFFPQAPATNPTGPIVSVPGQTQKLDSLYTNRFGLNLHAKASGSKQVLVTQTSDKLAMLLELGTDMTQTFDIDQLLPKIVDNLFQVFRQADRGFIILMEDGKLIPKVIKARRPDDESGFALSPQNRATLHRHRPGPLERGRHVRSALRSVAEHRRLQDSLGDVRAAGEPLDRAGVRRRAAAHAQSAHEIHARTICKLLLSVAALAAVAVENARMHESLISRAGLERDLKLAQQVQLSFLPKRFPQPSGYEFWAYYESASEVGGDYYDFIPLPDGRFGIMIGDVAGKGVPAALLMAKISSDARFTVLTESNLGQAIDKLNEQMQEAGMLDRFVTLGAGLLDVNSHEVVFVNAGHLPPLVYRKQSDKFEEPVTRDMSGFPLGVSEGIPYESCKVPLSPGTRCCSSPMALLEATNKDGTDFQGGGRVRCPGQGCHGAEVMGEGSSPRSSSMRLGCKQHDDLTVVSFGRQG